MQTVICSSKFIYNLFMTHMQAIYFQFQSQTPMFVTAYRISFKFIDNSALGVIYYQVDATQVIICLLNK